ncbi:MAG: thioredoxin family protein, partial [Verrucomicrobiota bacterium]
TTPHLFIVDASGTLVYAGAIDSNARPQFDPHAQNYVRQGIEELLAGKPLSVPSTKPYGCAVKY